MIFSSVNSEQRECTVGWMYDGDVPDMENEAVTFHEVLRAP